MSSTFLNRNDLGNLTKSISSRLPQWFRQDIPGEKTFRVAREIFDFDVNTVCQKAHCPNITHCFAENEVTFLILGGSCTRSCKFCQINQPEFPRDFTFDEDEPYKISRLVDLLGIQYAVITSVCRDDLLDGGAAVFAKTISLIHAIGKNIKVEVLIPDFQGKTASLESVLESEPEVLAHNLETVQRLYSHLRPQADYAGSLSLLSKAKEINLKVKTKSSLMLGLGEKKEEVVCAMEDLRKSFCNILVLGQYLAPSEFHHPVNEFVHPRQFDEYKEIALSMGFEAVLSKPLARSSYQAQMLYGELIHA